MTKKTVEKKIISLEPNFKDILVCKENQTCPFIEIFIQEPENVSQQNLGILAGIFDITDTSEDSSYIVNYLISIIKKEYYSKPKRGAIESFEAALHKGNLALSKLASHGNVNWLGQLNAICLVFEKSNIHFAQTGTAKAFLLRARVMTDITEGGEFQGEPNPIKTFTEVSSGRMQLGDKIILTTDAIFDIFSFEEIKKSALRFSEKDFVQFLNTALINELEKAGVLIVDIKEKKEKELASAPIEKETTLYENAFSQSAFKEKAKIKATKKVPANVEKTPAANQAQKPLENFMKEVEAEVKKNQEGFVDEKTGHIYIKEDTVPPQKSEPSFSEKIFDLKEKLSSASSNLLKSSGETSARGAQFFKNLEIKNKLLEKKDAASQRLVRLQEARRGKPTFRNQTELFLKNSFVPALQNFLSSAGEILRALAAFLLEKIAKPAVQAGINLFQKTRVQRGQFSASPTDPARIQEKNLIRRINSGIKISSVKKLKEMFLDLDYVKRIYVLLAIFAIFVVPYFIAKIDFSKKEEAPAVVEAPAPVLPLEDDKNVIRVKNVSSIYAGSEIIATVPLDNDAFAITKSQVVSLPDDETSSFPEGLKESAWATEMEDLGLIFIISPDGKTFSFSPISKKFQEGKLNFPSESEISSIKSYLTYLYALDPKNNQIYRYFRSDAGEGGFGEKINWLKDSTDLSKATGMAVSDNIYLAAESTLLKFFQGKKVDFSVESSATPIVFDQVFTKSGMENIYILDATNARIIKLSLDGVILAQYYNEAIGNAKGFSINEEKNLVYFFDTAGVKSFEME